MYKWGVFIAKGKIGPWDYSTSVMTILLVFGNIGSALALKIGGEDKAQEFQRTEKSFGEIPPGLYFIKIINIFNGVPKSKLKKIKILMGIKQNMGENDLEGGSSHVLILAVD